MTGLVLLGTVHRDPAGKTRLLKVLEEMRPAAISLEVSPASVELRQKQGRRWAKIFRRRLAALNRETGLGTGRLMSQAGLRGVFEYLRLPYEYRAALAYAQARACPLFLLDDSRLASWYLDRVESEILTKENMSLLAKVKPKTSLADEVTAEYALAHTRIFSPDSSAAPSIPDPEAWIEREARLSQKLRLLHQGLVRWADREIRGPELAQKLIVAPEAIGFLPDNIYLSLNAAHVYVGGWEHIVEDKSESGLFSRLKDLTPERRLCFNPGPGPEERTVNGI